MKNYRNIFTLISNTVLGLATLLVLSACNQSLTMETKTDVPTPLMTQLPVTMGVYYADEFRNYVYTEDSEDRPQWSIKSGASLVELFDSVLPSMFENVSTVSDINSAENVDAVLAPEVEEMQFALPNETRSDLYEVWIKYNVRLHKPNGDLLADWPVTGYGKTSTEFMKSRDKALQSAINSAFRDAGAKLALNFSKVPPVKEWLAGNPRVCEQDTANICDI